MWWEDLMVIKDVSSSTDLAELASGFPFIIHLIHYSRDTF